MLATQVRQKDSVFYFAAYPAEDLLDRVRFITRFYAEGEKSLKPDRRGRRRDDEVAHFIGKIERTDAAFQREMSRAKVGRDQELLRDGDQPAAHPGHGAPLHGRPARASSR